MHAVLEDSQGRTSEYEEYEDWSKGEDHKVSRFSVDAESKNEAEPKTSSKDGSFNLSNLQEAR